MIIANISGQISIQIIYILERLPVRKPIKIKAEILIYGVSNWSFASHSL